MSPREIVQELDKYIIGQNKAKRAVAIALRNRYRRSKLSQELKDDITPKNIIMKGPTGVGKTEIARRLAKLVNAPFVKRIFTTNVQKNQQKINSFLCIFHIKYEYPYSLPPKDLRSTP